MTTIIGAYSSRYPGYFHAGKILPGEEGFKCPDTGELYVKGKVRKMKRCPGCENVKALGVDRRAAALYERSRGGLSGD